MVHDTLLHYYNSNQLRVLDTVKHNKVFKAAGFYARRDTHGPGEMGVGSNDIPDVPQPVYETSPGGKIVC